MIFKWLVDCWHAILKLFIPPPARGPRINPNHTCPVCGHENGSLRAVEILSAPTQQSPVSRKTVCQHRCNECGARFYEEPIVKVNPAYVSPAIARNDIEKSEDMHRLMEANVVRQTKPMAPALPPASKTN